MAAISSASTLPVLSVRSGALGVVAKVLSEEADTPFGDAYRLRLASAFVNAGMHGRAISLKTDLWSLIWSELWHSRWYRSLMTAIALLHVCLAFLEAPSRMNVRSSSSFVLDTRPIEAGILVAYLIDIALKMRFMGGRSFLRRWQLLEITATALFALDLVLPFRGGLGFSRILRPLFVISRRKHIRFIVTGIVYSLPRMLPVLFLLVACVTLCAVPATLLFSTEQPAFAGLRTNETAAPPYCSVFSRGGCAGYFDSVSTATWSFFVLAGRANWPGVMLPFYAISEFAGLFFAAFLLVNHFFLWRLLLAVSFASFTDHVRSQYLAQQRRTRASFKAAFSLLSSGGFLAAPVWAELAALVRPELPLGAVEVLFLAAGGRCGYLNAQGFVAACSLLDLRVESLEGGAAGSALMRLRRWLEAAVTSAALSATLDAAMLLSALAEWALEPPEALADAFAMAAIAAIAADVLARAVALGPRRYARSWGSAADLAVLALSIGTLLGYSGASAAAAIERLRILLTLRVVRALRIVHHLAPFRNTFDAVREILPLLWRFLLVLALLIYAIAILGVELFTGSLSLADPAVAASSYGVNGQGALSWDTFTKATMASFSILVTTQSPILAEGLMASSGSWAPAAYYALAYVLLVCVASNILLSMLLQSFRAASSRAAERASGRVQLWEHLLAAAQLERFSTGAHAAPLVYLYSRRSAFLTVNETLFGEGVTLECEEEEAAEEEEGGAGREARKERRVGNSASRSWHSRQASAAGSASGGLAALGEYESARPARSACCSSCASCAADICAHLCHMLLRSCSGAAAAAPAPLSAEPIYGATSIRVHSLFDSHAFFGGLARSDASADSPLRTRFRSLTELIKSDIVPPTGALAAAAFLQALALSLARPGPRAEDDLRRESASNAAAVALSAQSTPLCRADVAGAETESAAAAAFPVAVAGSGPSSLAGSAISAMATPLARRPLSLARVGAAGGSGGLPPLAPSPASAALTPATAEGAGASLRAQRLRRIAQLVGELCAEQAALRREDRAMARTAAVAPHAARLAATAAGPADIIGSLNAENASGLHVSRGWQLLQSHPQFSTHVSGERLAAASESGDACEAATNARAGDVPIPTLPYPTMAMPPSGATGAGLLAAVGSMARGISLGTAALAIRAALGGTRRSSGAPPPCQMPMRHAGARDAADGGGSEPLLAAAACDGGTGEGLRMAAETTPRSASSALASATSTPYSTVDAWRAEDESGGAVEAAPDALVLGAEVQLHSPRDRYHSNSAPAQPVIVLRDGEAIFLE